MPCPLFPGEEPNPNRCFHVPGSTFRVVVNSTALTKPLSMKTAAVPIVTANGTVPPLKVENLAQAIGRTSTVYAIGYQSICLAIVVRYDSTRLSSVTTNDPFAERVIFTLGRCWKEIFFQIPFSG